MKNKQFGDYGEKIAVQHLESQGFKIVDSNVFTRFGEIDIVAYKGECYHFVEVKSRSSNKYGSAVESLNKNKIKHILKSVDIYLAKNALENVAISIDLLAIDFEGNSMKPQITWLENITM